MHRMMVLIAVVVAVGSVSGCGSGNSCPCGENGLDCLGRGSNTYFDMECVTTGVDQTCRLLQRGETGYCAASNAGTTIDVTSTAQWTSSDPTIAVIVSPGVIHPVGSGVVTISAVTAAHAPYFANFRAFNVVPGTPPEPLTRLSVETLGNLAVGGTITVVPQRGPSQTCVAAPSSANPVDGTCLFNVFAGSVAIHATNANNALAADATVQASSYYQVTSLSLMPVLSKAQS